MKKLIILILSALMLLINSDINISAEGPEAPTEAGLYCTSDPYYVESNYISLDNHLYLCAGANNDVIFVYYDGANYQNVSADVKFVDNQGQEVLNNDYFDKEVIDMEYGDNQNRKTQKAVKFTVKSIGQSNLNVAYTISATTYRIESIGTSYLDFFAIEKGVKPTEHLDKIKVDINTSVNAVSYYDLYYLEQGLPTRYDETTTFHVYQHGPGPDYSTSDAITLVYDEDNSSFKITGVKEGGCFICPDGDTNKRIGVQVQPEIFPQTQVVVEQGNVPEIFGPISSFDFTYGSDEYKIGLGNDSGSDTLHIDSASVINLSDERPGCGGELLIGKKQAGSTDTYLPADSTIYQLFSDIEFKVVAENTTGISAVRTKKRALGVLTDSIVLLDESDEISKAMIEISFKFNGESHSIKYGVIIKKTKDLEFNDISVDDFTSANFATKESLERLIDQTIDEPSITKVTINLDNTKIYNSINIAYGNELDSLIINGNGATLKGTLSSNNAVSEVYDIIFDNTEGDANAKGLVSINQTYGPSTEGSISRVEYCTFKNYKYGIYSEGNSMICGVQNCGFENCGTGIYVNSYGCAVYSDYRDDVFMNCDKGIELVQIPYTCVPYQFVMKYMTFISKEGLSSIDYDVHCNGNFFFTENFYGKYDASEHPNPDPENISVRSAGIKYHNSNRTESKVYTNPCIRHNGQDLGIDPNPNLFTAIFFTDSGTSNLLPLDDLNEGIKLDICENGSGNQLASVKFKEVQ